MKAIILAAGRGSRMGAGTAESPKCMTRLAGKSLLDWQLASITQAGISDITVIGGYASHLLNGGQYALRHNPVWAESNMVTTLCCALDLLRSEPCIVSYSDIVYRPEHVSRLAAACGDLAITYDKDWASLWQERFADPLADAETFREENGVLQEIGGRASQIEEIGGQYMGLLRFTPTAWAHVEAVLASLTQERRARLDMTSLLSMLLAQGEKITCVAVSGGWCEVDCENDVRCYEDKLAEPASWSHDWRLGI